MMSRIGKILVGFGLIGVIVLVASDFSGGSPVRKESGKSQSNSLPRLVDLGSGKCIPCKMMAPIL